MAVSSMKRRRIILLTVAVGIFALLTAISSSVLRPGVSVIFEGAFDPTETRVRIDNKLLSPSGKDGREYKTRVFIGKRILTVNGPLIEEVKEDLSVGLGGSTRTISTKPASYEAIVKNAVQQNDATVSQAKVYESKWLIAFVSNMKERNKDGDDDYPILLRYNSTKSVWERGSSDNSDWIEEMPAAARGQFETLAND